MASATFDPAIIDLSVDDDLTPPEVIDMTSSSSSNESDETSTDANEKCKLRRTQHDSAVPNKKKNAIIDLASIERKSSTSSTTPKSSMSHKYNTRFTVPVEKEHIVVTREIMTLLKTLNLTNISMCFGGNDEHLLYVQQSDKWSCGYRNLQMVLSSLLPTLEPDHPYFKSCVNSHCNVTNSGVVKIPSLGRIQQGLEASWKDGFDPNGAEHYRNKIYGTQKKIGAVEVASLLSFLYMDCTVVQFMKTLESRSFIGRFIWHYFHRSGWNIFCEDSSFSMAETIAHAAQQQFEDKPRQKRPREENHSKYGFPLYLQWQGHSVTVIGIEKCPVMGNDYDIRGTHYNLLIFDPGKSGQKLKEKIQLFQRTQRMNHFRDVMNIMRLPVEKILKKDLQIVLCSSRTCRDVERMSCRKQVRVLNVTG